MAASPRRYTIDEANAAVPEVRAVLLQLVVEQRRLDEARRRILQRRSGNGGPASPDGGDPGRELVEIGQGIRALLGHLEALGVQVRDVQQGLVDFPAERDGQPVWLCWKLSDPAVAHWHRTDEGFANRRPW